MTEAEWLTKSASPLNLFRRVAGKGRARRIRLCVSACCRRLAHLMPEPRWLEAIAVAEAFADQVATRTERQDAEQKMMAFAGAIPPPRTNGEGAMGRSAVAVAHLLRTNRYYAASALHAARSGAVWASLPESDPYVPEVELGVEFIEDHPAYAQENSAQAALTRDIFRLCFSPVAFDLSWRTMTVLSLALAAYKERSLPSGELNVSRLAVLSDALEEAGCPDDAILSHLRSPGPHVRGCWALDLILGKS